MRFLKNNITLVIGLSIPVLMIISMAGVIYLPGIFIHPQTNFLYVVGDITNSCQKYSVSNHKLVLKGEIPTNCASYNNTHPKLYIYNVEEKTSSEVTPETAMALTLNESANSPDGFTVVNGTGGGGSLFLLSSGRYDYNSQYLIGHGYSSKIDFTTQSGDYYNQFRFLGWITS